jgi:hypothetical protein
VQTFSFKRRGVLMNEEISNIIAIGKLLLILTGTYLLSEGIIRAFNIVP